MGFNTVSIARGAEKGDFATQLGASHYIDSTKENVAEGLQALGGAKVVLVTVTNADAMAATIDGLGRRGELILVGVSPEPLNLTAMQVFSKAHKIYGHSSGSAVDTQDTLKFAAQSGVRPWIEVLPLEEAGAAMGKMLSNQARFRMVLITGN